jgi:hypothetical protein
MKHYIGPFLVLAALGCGSVSPAGGDDPGTGGAPKAMSVAGADGGEAGAAGTAPDAGEPQGAAGTAPDGGAGAAPDACGPPVLVVSWTITDLATLAPVSCTDIGSPDIRLTVSPQGGGTEFAPFGVVLPCAPGGGSIDLSPIPTTSPFFSYDIRVESPTNSNTRAAWARGDTGGGSALRSAAFRTPRCGTAAANLQDTKPFQIVVGVPASCDVCTKAAACCSAEGNGSDFACPSPSYERACAVVFGEERDAEIAACTAYLSIAPPVSGTGSCG